MTRTERWKKFFTIMWWAARVHWNSFLVRNIAFPMAYILPAEMAEQLLEGVIASIDRLQNEAIGRRFIKKDEK